MEQTLWTTPIINGNPIAPNTEKSVFRIKEDKTLVDALAVMEVCGVNHLVICKSENENKPVGIVDKRNLEHFIYRANNGKKRIVDCEDLVKQILFIENIDLIDPNELNKYNIFNSDSSPKDIIKGFVERTHNNKYSDSILIVKNQGDFSNPDYHIYSIVSYKDVLRQVKENFKTTEIKKIEFPQDEGVISKNHNSKLSEIIELFKSGYELKIIEDKGITKKRVFLRAIPIIEKKEENESLVFRGMIYDSSFDLLTQNDIDNLKDKEAINVDFLTGKAFLPIIKIDDTFEVALNQFFRGAKYNTLPVFEGIKFKGVISYVDVIKWLIRELNTEKKGVKNEEKV